MTMVYTPFDEAIASNKMRFTIGIAPEVAVDAGLPNRRQDVDLAFQFPPKIVGDSRGGNWEETQSSPALRDIIAVYKGPKPRRIAMQWIYIVDGNRWSITRIKQQLKYLRGYFVGPSLQEGSPVASSLVLWIRLWSVGGDDIMSFRIQDVNIKHGETLIGTVDGDVFPLRTEVSLELLSWPKISAANGQPVALAGGQQEITPQWF